MSNWTISIPNYESDLVNSKLAVSPWAGHRSFAYDLIKYIDPATVVELGTHYGCSFFTFCQSIKDNGLNTRLIAVDTWQGDHQAGFYDNSVYEIVMLTINLYFQDLPVVLERKTFQEASLKFPDESIDIIHIDGLHTYDAVSEDFRTWLPKLRENGIMLFHDTAHLTGYGSHTFWEEVKVQYPHFEFQHSWGLGVLFPKGDYWHRRLLEQNFHDKTNLYFYKAEYELSQIQVNDLEKMATERFQAMQEMEKMVQERDEVINGQKALIDERYAVVQGMEIMIQERDEVINGQKALIDERYAVVQGMEKMIQERDEVINGQKALIDERYAVVQGMEKMIQERDEVINGQKALIDERYAVVQGMEKMVQERDEVINGQKALIDERYAEVQEMEKMIQERDEVINGQKALIDERYAVVQEMEKMIQERDGVIDGQKSLIDERYVAMREIEQMVKERDKTIDMQKELIISFKSK